jgi:hypothetical protein
VSEEHDLDTLEWDEPDSSNVQRISWRADTLYVEFKGGSVYRYHGVPEDEYETLKSAVSAGRYLRARIQPRYDALRIL